MGRPRDLRFWGDGWMLMGLLASGAGDKEWMAMGIIIGWICLLAAAINAKIDALMPPKITIKELPTVSFFGNWPAASKPKKDLA